MNFVYILYVNRLLVVTMIPQIFNKNSTAQITVWHFYTFFAPLLSFQLHIPSQRLQGKLRRMKTKLGFNGTYGVQSWRK